MPPRPQSTASYWRQNHYFCNLIWPSRLQNEFEFISVASLPFKCEKLNFNLVSMSFVCQKNVLSWFMVQDYTWLYFSHFFVSEFIKDSEVRSASSKAETCWWRFLLFISHFWADEIPMFIRVTLVRFCKLMISLFKALLTATQVSYPPRRLLQ
jgi:hypothetical protein